MVGNLICREPLSASSSELSKKSIQLIEKKYYDWLVSTSVSETENFQDGLFDENMIDKAVALDANSRKDNQRLLLDVERTGELKRAEARKQQLSIKNKAKSILAKYMLSDIKKHLNDTDYVVNKLVPFPSAFSDVMYSLYSPATNYRNLTKIIALIPGLEKQLIGMVNDSKFSRSINRTPRKVKDLQSAVGAIGVTGLRQLLPMIIFKRFIRFDCPLFPMLGPKIWSYTIVKSNAARILLKSADYGREDGDELDIFFLSLFHSIGLMAIHRQFARSFDDVKLKCLELLRENQDRALYNAMLDVDPSEVLLTKAMIGFEGTLTKRIAGEFDWGRLKHVEPALFYTYGKSPEEAKLHSLALHQSKIYARTDMLRQAKRLDNEDQYKAVLKGIKMTASSLSLLKSSNLRQANLREYIGT